MKSNGLLSLLIAGVLGISAAACQKREAGAAGDTTPGVGTPAAEATALPTAAPTPEARSAVTADPVEASQRNASRRRAPRSPATEPAPASEARQRPREKHEVPAGTILRVTFDKPISTATAKDGETYRGELLDDLLATDGTVVAPSGSRVTGRVDHVVSSGKLARPAELRFRLTELTARGRTVPVSTSVYERTGDTHTKRNAGYIAGGAAVGAILGQILGKDTKSTVAGAAAGAAAGTGVAAATGDLDFTIEPGRTVAFTLEEALEL